MNKKKLFFICALMTSLYSSAQNFDKFFTDNTLRIDYCFSGNERVQNISLDEISVSPRWYGKRNNLKSVPMEGNGQIDVYDKKTNELIYKNSFSTLFQEWLTYPEAKNTTRSFENVFLIPMPKDSVIVKLSLKNNRHKIITEYSQIVSPKDILIRQIGHDKTPFVTLQAANDTSKCIHIAYVAEGYTKKEMNLFIKDCYKAMEALFSHEPFKKNRSKFNIVAVECSSKESGTSEPSKGIWKNTALQSNFCTFYSERYLTTLRLKKLHDILAGIPYEHIIILVNTSEYGGGGILNSYNLSMTHNKYFLPVVVHEFGHSFAGLADEYAYETEPIPAYPFDIEPWEANITTLVDFKSKWKDLLLKNTPIPTPIGKNLNRVGVYEGAGYCLKHVYRALPDCRMRTNENPNFCAVCQRFIQHVIDFYTQ